jgi:hypothetical protein
MATYSSQKYGGTSTLGTAAEYAKVYEMVFDIKKAVADGYASGDSAVLMTLPAGFILLALDAVITETLVISGGNTVDIGTDVSDPDDYVDAQSTTAVGRFGAYVGACVVPVVITTASTLYIEINASTITSGKIALTVVGVDPASGNVPRARPKVYTN